MEKRAERTKRDFRCQFAAQPLVKTFVWFARAVVNWRFRSVAKTKAWFSIYLKRAISKHMATTNHALAWDWTADISRCHYWLPYEMTSEKRAQTCHTDIVGTSQIWTTMAGNPKIHRPLEQITDFGIFADVSIYETGLDWLFLLINWTKRKVLI